MKEHLQLKVFCLGFFIKPDIPAKLLIASEALLSRVVYCIPLVVKFEDIFKIRETLKKGLLDQGCQSAFQQQSMQ